jgi:hypothetical protein
MQAVIGPMRERRSGTIINVTSVAGKLSISPLGPYRASKSALAAVNEALAQELKAFEVRVAIVEPGIIETRMARNIEAIKGSNVYPQRRRNARVSIRISALPRRPSCCAAFPSNALPRALYCTNAGTVSSYSKLQVTPAMAFLGVKIDWCRSKRSPQPRPPSISICGFPIAAISPKDWNVFHCLGTSVYRDNLAVVTTPDRAISVSVWNGGSIWYELYGPLARRRFQMMESTS